MRGEQRLVGGDDVGAGVDRLQQVGLARRLDAAHQLDHDVGAEDQRLGVGREQLAAAGRRRAARRGRARRCPTSSSAAPARSASSSPCLQQQRGDLRAHGSGAQQRHPQSAVVGHACSLGVMSVRRLALDARRCRRRGPAGRRCVSPRTITRARAAAHRDDGRARDIVVVARERDAVGAGRGHGEQIAGRDVAGQVLGVDDDVARLAVLADDAHERGLAVADARGDARRELRAVERGAGVVAHAAVDADVQALRAGRRPRRPWWCRPRRA